MCLAAFAIHASARWPLVIASNRDEFYDRPAVPMARWQTANGHSIISGRDLRGGGTWLGTTPGGRIALLTNVRDVQEASAAPPPRTRGELVTAWLEGAMDADRFMAQTDCMRYGGFNMVLGDLQSDRWSWVSNRAVDVAGPAKDRPHRLGWCSKPLAPGIHGLSNAALDTPWPKTVALKTALRRALECADEASLEADLWAALASRQQAPDGDLPDTGLPLSLENSLSSAFIDEPARGASGYGTRCSTLLGASVADDLLPGSWAVRIKEKTHDDGALRMPQLPRVASCAFRFLKT
jgi:uncharacterized protein with NRDE domain